MSRIIVNGIFYNSNLTGIERFAHEVTGYLDMIAKPGEVILVLPADVQRPVPQFENILVKKLPRTPGKKQFNNVKLNTYLLSHKGVCIDFTNHIPWVGKSVVFLHDVYSRVCPNDFKTARDIQIRDKACKMYRRIAKKAKIVCTVSQYSKKQIEEYYSVPTERIKVIYNGVEHIWNTLSDEGIFVRYPQLRTQEFFFCLGSLSVRKNLKWIVNHARLYPNEFFVISGMPLSSVIPSELEDMRKLQNILCVGYITDGEVKALMQACKAFIFPSYFEGFGIPPLEALACGVPAIVSKASCLPEIYEDCVYYLDPHESHVDLNILLQGSVASPDKLFSRYSYRKAAEQLYELAIQIK